MVFWLGWPVFWLYLHGSRRTRLLVVCDDEFLVLRGWIGTGKWVLPGGGLHKGEDPVAGLIREVKEETGIEFTKNQPEFLFTGTYNKQGLSFKYDCYALQLAQKPQIQMQRLEIIDYSWQPLNRHSAKLSQDTREAVGKWLTKR